MRTPVETQMREELTATATLMVSPIDEVAETIRTDAVDFARRQVDGEDAGLMSLLGRRDFFESFEYGLVSKVAEVLAATDYHILAVYTYDVDMNPDAEIGGELPLDATVRLLVHVSTPSAALQAFIDALDRALLTQLEGVAVAVIEGAHLHPRRQSDHRSRHSTAHWLRQVADIAICTTAQGLAARGIVVLSSD